MLIIRRCAIGLALALLAAGWIASGATAAEKATPASAVKGPLQAEATYDDPLGRSTPQGTVVGFLRAMQREDYERAVDFLDTRQTGKRAELLAIELHHILDQGLSAGTTMLSNKPEGNLQDGLPVNQQSVGEVKTKMGSHKILLQRVQKENNPPIWLFSSETLKLVPQIYEEMETPWLERQLPAYMTETHLLGYPIYRLLLTILLLPAALGIGWLATALIRALVRSTLRRHLDERLLEKLSRVKNPLRLIFAAAVVYLYSRGVLSLLAQLFWNFMAATIAVIGLTWLVVQLIETGSDVLEKRGNTAGDAVVRLTATLLKTVAVVTGLVVIFYYFAGINLTAVVAGLGVGGIAVAFAAQKTLENLFGGVVLVWDKPIRLGDVCKAGDYTGTVEHIGIRSTQIRTPSRTVVSIPNGLLSSISVENLTLRDSILFKHTLNLRYETTADQLRYILAQIREMLYQHPRVDSTSARIRFVGFGQSSIDLEIFAYVLETEYEAFLPVQEDLLLRIMDLVEASGSGLAFPSQTVYMSKDGGLDVEKGRAAVEAVKKWRDQGELPFPDHRPAKVSQLDGTLEYPPKGSASSPKKEGSSPE